MSDTKYNIKTTDGQRSFDVSESEIDSSQLPISLIGHSAPSYGEEQNNNFVHLLENFASDTPPENALRGQLWCKLATGDTCELNVCQKSAIGGNPAEWKKIVILNSSESEPTNSVTGDMWYDSKAHTFKIYDDGLTSNIGDTTNKWNIIGPEDTIHKKYINETQVLSGNETVKEYVVNTDNFTFDIENDKENSSAYNGSLNAITAQIIVKEKINPNTVTEDTSPRYGVWTYKFVVQSYKQFAMDTTFYNVNLVGQPSYELLALSENTDWNVDVIFDTSKGIVIRFSDNSGIKLGAEEEKSLVIGYNIDIVRV